MDSLSRLLGETNAPAKAQRRKEIKEHSDFNVFSWRLGAFAGNCNQTAPLPLWKATLRLNIPDARLRSLVFTLYVFLKVRDRK